MKRVIKKEVFTIKPYVPGQPIDEVKRELGLKDVIKLASNENPYGPSPKVLKAVFREARNLNRYPDSDCYCLRKVLAKRLNVNGDQLIFGNGSDELIVLAIKALIRHGDEVVIAKPSFLIYDIASRLAGAKIKAVPLKDFHYDLNAMAGTVGRKTRIVFLGNPDNPSGKYLTGQNVRDFLKKIRRDVLVFMDEAYFEYVQAGDYVDSLKLLKSHPNVMVTRTFSKMYGLAGLRIGYGIASREFADILNRIREPFNVNSIAQAAAIAVLQDSAYYKDIARKIGRQRQYLYRSLGKLNLDFVDSATNFVLVKVPGRASAIAKKLLQKGVIIRDMGLWGMTRYIRVTIGTAIENKRFIQSLKEVL
jgi:histidinol-phosphate aminotransferase